jgi:hypothetical protein
MVERLDTHNATHNAICDGTPDGTRQVIRQVTIVLPDDLPNSTYANLVRGLQGLLHATKLGPRTTIHPDPHITDEELNAAFNHAAEYDPWAP